MADITAILPAAGSGKRFGENKLLVNIEGVPLIGYSIAAMKPCDRTIVIVRPDDVALQSYLEELNVEWIPNPYPSEGMGYSIACGVQASAHSQGWCIMPADMPYVQASTTQQVIQALAIGAPLVAPFYQGKRGHPVGFNQRFLGELLALEGDTGAREILARHFQHVCFVATEDAGILRDIDTPQDLGPDFYPVSAKQLP